MNFDFIPRNATFAGLALLCIGLLGGTGKAQTYSEELMSKIGVEQKLGAKLPLNAEFTDEDGKLIKLGSLIGKRPVILMPLFFNCQTGCALMMENLVRTLTKATVPPRSGASLGKRFDILVGRDVDIIFLGIHPEETYDLARARKALILSAYNKPESEDSWHLLVGEQDQILKVTDAIGFRYSYDAKKNQINHPALAAFITREGVVSSYIVSQEYPTSVVQEDIAVAARNEIGKEAEVSLFGCIMTDPETGERTVIWLNVIRLISAIFLVGVIAWLINLTIRGRGKPAPSTGGNLA